jgi:FkbM family methyltransferase
MLALFRKLPITQIKLVIAKVLYMSVTLVFGKGKRIIKRNGLYFEADLSEGLDLSLFIFGNFQKHVSANPYLKIHDNSVIFDVGANVGIMALQFAKTAPRGRVFAFEPTNYAYGKLHRNLELNSQINNITPIQTFVSKESTQNHQLKAYSSWKVDGKRVENKHPVHGGTAMPATDIPAISLDDFCENEKVSRLDFIKIDTDGHEMEVLLGAAGCIKTFRPQIIFEVGLYVMEEHNITFTDYWEFFSDLNYKLFNSANKRPVDMLNYKTVIPAKGTIDILALPIE